MPTLASAAMQLGTARLAVEPQMPFDRLLDLVTHPVQRIKGSHRILKDQGDVPPPHVAHLGLAELEEVGALEHDPAADRTVVGMCGGKGAWTRIPCSRGSEFNCPISFKRSASLVDSGKTRVSEKIPKSAQAFSLRPTYTFEAGSSPTRTNARPGCTP